MQSYIIEIIEKLYDPHRMNPILFTHYCTVDSELIETSNDIPSDINLLECGLPSESDSVICGDYLAYILTSINTYDPDDNVKNIVVNVDSDLLPSDDFSCLVNCTEVFTLCTSCLHRFEE